MTEENGQNPNVLELLQKQVEQQKQINDMMENKRPLTIGPDKIDREQPLTELRPVIDVGQQDI